MDWPSIGYIHTFVLSGTVVVSDKEIDDKSAVRVPYMVLVKAA